MELERGQGTVEVGDTHKTKHYYTPLHGVVSLFPTHKTIVLST